MSGEYTEWWRIRAKPSERAAWEAAAERAGLDYSAWTRLVLNAGAKKEVKVELR